jgi:hypothetical protein
MKNHIIINSLLNSLLQIFSVQLFLSYLPLILLPSLPKTTALPCTNTAYVTPSGQLLSPYVLYTSGSLRIEKTFKTERRTMKMEWCPLGQTVSPIPESIQLQYCTFLHGNAEFQFIDRTEPYYQLEMLYFRVILGTTQRFIFSGYRSRGPGFDSRRSQIFWEAVGLERRPLGLVRKTE